MCDYCSWVDQILAKIKAETRGEKKLPVRVDPVIIVHGGAGKIPREQRDYMLNEVKTAAVKAYNDLIKGCTSVDAVERAISYMESKPYFNCAKGGSLDANEEIVTDAAIVNAYQAGCVGAVRDIEHPITFARKVMENTEHVLIVEKGAQRFALEMGIPVLHPGDLNKIHESVMSENSVCQMEREQSKDSFVEIDRTSSTNEEMENKQCIPECVVERAGEGEDICPFNNLTRAISEETIEPILFEAGAVGTVAYDRKKRLACGTSTAGKPHKPIGSVSAIGTVIGCGIYADETGCVSISGEDRHIYSYAPARKIVRRLQEETSIDKAVNIELENFVSETGESHIGAIALNAKGQSSVSFKCMHFPWALCREGYVYYGCTRNEKFSEKIKILERPLDCMCGNFDLN